MEWEREEAAGKAKLFSKKGLVAGGAQALAPGTESQLDHLLAV